MTAKPSFFAELKRRNVYKVAVAYAVVGWLVIQVSSTVLPTFHAPEWVVQTLVVIVAIGFPVALVIAWAFEATPEGIKRTEVADAMPDTARPKKYTWVYIVLIGAAISVAVFFASRAGKRNSVGNIDLGDGLTARVLAKSIAVLPFDNLSRDPDNAFFAEGVQDEILTRLAKVADLKVISRTSTQHFKSAPDNLPQIAKQLGVTNILEGSVQKANDQVRVNVQLINAMTDAHLWAEIYDRKLTDIFVVESDIAKTIADQLQAKLTGSEKSAIAKKPTDNPEAYELCLKANMFLRKRSGDNIPQAIALYEQALTRDPNYALAYAGLAESYALRPYYTSTRQRDDHPKAKEAALKALQLDPNLAEGHRALGKVLSFTMDLPGSAIEFQRAIELKPNDAEAHHWYSNGPLIALGKVDEAIAEGRRSIELDPLSPIINADFGNTLYCARRYDEAMAQFRKTVELDPTFFYTHYNLGMCFDVKGDFAGAMAEYEKANQLSYDPSIVALLGAVKTKAGDKNAAPQALQELDRISQEREVLAYSRALLYLSMGNKAEAIRWLEQSFADGDGSDIGYAKVEPMLDPLRGDARFEALVQKVIAPAK